MSSLGRYINEVSKISGIRPTTVISACFDMFKDGLTVPFIARYRANQIEYIAADKVFELQKHYDVYQQLEKSRNSKLEKLSHRGLLTPILQQTFMNCTSIDVLDDLWQPFKAEKKANDFTIASSIAAICELSENIVKSNEKKQYGPLSLPGHLEHADFIPQRGLLALVKHAITTDAENRELGISIIDKNLCVTANFKKITTDEMRSKSNFKSYGTLNF